MNEAGIEVVARPAATAAPPERIEGRSIAEWRSEARELLGLDRAPVVACGHQCACWHPGILAKNLWVDAIAERDAAQAVHVMVDQDGFDGVHVEWPARGADGWWRLHGHRFASESGLALGHPAFMPRSVEPGEGTPAEVADGLERLQEALRRNAQACDAAEQVTRAMLESAAAVLRPPAIVRASQLLRTSLGLRLLDRMLQDPEACANAFNEALSAAPRSARPLRVMGGRSELPLWLTSAAGERTRATPAETRAALSAGRPLLPRAFLMGALARTALSDRFVHGLGGATYEQVTDRWLRRWLGWAPPAFDVVSATLRLPLEVPGAAAPPAMPWRRAWCDPELLASGGRGPSAARRRLLDLIASVPPRDPRRRSIYRELVEERNAARLRRSGELETLQAAEAAVGARRLAAELAARRTWCFVLQPAAALSRLRDAVRARRPRA
jgi:hypothetical protein